MAPNFKLMAFTMSVAIGSKWLLDTEDPGERWGDAFAGRASTSGDLADGCVLCGVGGGAVQAWAIRGAYLLSQVVSYGILATLYFKAKVRVRLVGREGVGGGGD